MHIKEITQLKSALRAKANPGKVPILQRFFKTGKGEYAEGDKFLGITVPEQRKIAKTFENISLSKLAALLKSIYHEERHTALIIMVAQYKRGHVETQKAIYDLYLDNIKYINNWDLVDVSAEYIVGAWLEDKNKSVLIEMAHSNLVWKRRIAMLSTFCYIKKGNSKWALKIAAILVEDEHDLIQKAVGWMLRELGKRCSLQEEEKFLKKHYQRMPRTMLRYAIERFEKKKRLEWLKK